jgi:hypothetical protein
MTSQKARKNLQIQPIGVSSCPLTGVRIQRGSFAENSAETPDLFGRWNENTRTEREWMPAGHWRPSVGRIVPG